MYICSGRVTNCYDSRMASAVCELTRPAMNSTANYELNYKNIYRVINYNKYVGFTRIFSSTSFRLELYFWYKGVLLMSMYKYNLNHDIFHVILIVLLTALILVTGLVLLITTGVLLTGLVSQYICRGRMASWMKDCIINPRAR